jgi:hypothetical protein
LKTPIALFIYNRPDCVKQALDKLSLIEFYELYIFADGPCNSNDSYLCDKCVETVKSHRIYKEKSCKLIKNKENKGMVNQICHGLDFVFSNHDSLIYLQDDQEINSSSYNYCNELLDIYKNNNEIGHINLSNFMPKYTRDFGSSYFFSHFISVWGFGTWKRVWNSYDPQMKEWNFLNKQNFLKKYFTNSKHRNAVKKMYDLHCLNDDPWTWDYQWEFNCLNNAPISITPTVNLCRDIGFNREDSTHNKGVNPFDNPLQEISLPLIHPKDISVDRFYHKTINNIICPSNISIIKGKFLNNLKRFILNK